MIKKIAYADARAVEETAVQLDIATLGAGGRAVAGARRIDIYGVGASAFVACDFQQKLHRIGRIAFAWSDTHIALTSAALLDERDVAVRHLAHGRHDRHDRRAHRGRPARRARRWR